MTIYEIPLLRRWREVWHRTDPEGRHPVHSFAEEVDTLAAARGRIADFARDCAEIEGLGDELDRWMDELERCEAAGAGVRPPPRTSLLEHAARCRGGIRAAQWRRWLELERSLSILIRAGELLAVSILLRSMLDELILAVTVERLEARLITVADASAGEWDVLDYSRLVLGRVVAPIGRERPVPKRLGAGGLRKDPLDVLGKELSGRIAHVYARLNNFVHPNAPSHFVTFHPERPEAGAAVLEGFNLVYEHFLELSWVRELESPIPLYRYSMPAIGQVAVEEDHLRLVDRFMERSEGRRALEAAWKLREDSARIEVIQREFWGELDAEERTALHEYIGLLAGAPEEATITVEDLEGLGLFWDEYAWERLIKVRQLVHHLQLRSGTAGPVEQQTDVQGQGAERLLEPLRLFFAISALKYHRLRNACKILSARECFMGAQILARSLMEISESVAHVHDKAHKALPPGCAGDLESSLLSDLAAPVLRFSHDALRKGARDIDFLMHQFLWTVSQDEARDAPLGWLQARSPIVSSRLNVKDYSAPWSQEVFGRLSNIAHGEVAVPAERADNWERNRDDVVMMMAGFVEVEWDEETLIDAKGREALLSWAPLLRLLSGGPAGGRSLETHLRFLANRKEPSVARWADAIGKAEAARRRGAPYRSICEQLEVAEDVARGLAGPRLESAARVALCQAMRGHLLVQEGRCLAPEDTALGQRLLLDAAEIIKLIDSAKGVKTRGRRLGAAIGTILNGSDPETDAAVAELWGILVDVHGQFAALTGLPGSDPSAHAEP